MIISAFQIAGGIQINRQVGAGEGPSEMVLSSEMVFEGDPGWAEALAAVGSFEAVPEPPSERTLEQARAAGIAWVNTLSGVVRRKFITDIPGQEAIYLMKLDEAQAWTADPAPDMQKYPLIAAEIGITGQDAYQVAQVYMNLSGIYVEAASQLETARLGAIAVIETATTVAEIDAATAALEVQIGPMT